MKNKIYLYIMKREIIEIHNNNRTRRILKNKREILLTEKYIQKVIFFRVNGYILEHAGI